LDAAALRLFSGSRQPGLPTRDKFFRLEDLSLATGSAQYPSDVPMDDPFSDERIRKAVELNLSAMGFRKVPEGKPDFFIDVQYSVNVPTKFCRCYDAQPGKTSLSPSTMNWAAIAINIMPNCACTRPSVAADSWWSSESHRESPGIL
jgi:hypothetical protein